MLASILICREFEDLSHGQAILHDVVERQGIPVFNNIRVALDSTATLIKENLNPQDLGPRNMVSPVKMGHVPMGDKIMWVFPSHTSNLMWNFYSCQVIVFGRPTKFNSDECDMVFLKNLQSIYQHCRKYREAFDALDTSGKGELTLDDVSVLISYWVHFQSTCK